MLDVLGVVWTIVWAVLKYPFLIVVTFVGSIFGTFACVLGNEIVCSGLGDMYLTFFEALGICLLGAGVLFALWRPKLVLAYLHYFFVPHPAAEALRERGTADSPLPIDREKLSKGLLGAPPPWWMPEFVERNRARKAALHTEELKVETELMKQVFERERARGRAEEAKKR